MVSYVSLETVVFVCFAFLKILKYTRSAIIFVNSAISIHRFHLCSETMTQNPTISNKQVFFFISAQTDIKVYEIKRWEEEDWGKLRIDIRRLRNCRTLHPGWYLDFSPCKIRRGPEHLQSQLRLGKAVHSIANPINVRTIKTKNQKLWKTKFHKLTLQKQNKKGLNFFRTLDEEAEVLQWNNDADSCAARMLSRITLDLRRITLTRRKRKKTETTKEG